MRKTFTSREFNQDTSGAKNAARHSPVFITDRGKPAFVLLSIDAYHRLADPSSASIIELLAMPAPEGDIEFEVPRTNVQLRPVDLAD